MQTASHVNHADDANSLDTPSSSGLTNLAASADPAIADASPDLRKSRVPPDSPTSTASPSPLRSTITPESADPVASVERLPDDDLVDRLDSFTRRECLTTLEILIHLAEIERRRLWRTLEYRSMFDYCVRRLRYSEGAASRRIRTARLIARHPSVSERIRDRRLSLCVASRIARAVLEDGRMDLIDQVEGKRLDQVDAMLATHRNPSRPVRESIRLLCVERPIENTEVTPVPRIGLDEKAEVGGFAGDVGEGSPAHPGGATSDGAGDDPSSNPATNSDSEPGVGTMVSTTGDGYRQNSGKKLTRIERIFRFQFGVNAETMAMFSRVQSIAATRAGKHVDLTDLFATLCDTYLDRYDPIRQAQIREEARRKRRERNAAGECKASMSNQTYNASASKQESEASLSKNECGVSLSKNECGVSLSKLSDATNIPPENAGNAKPATKAVVMSQAVAGTAPSARRSVTTRHIPRVVRDQVFLRDGGRCTFIERDGQRCAATVGLQVDHVMPFSLGGKHELSNLRLLCSAHNQLMAERTFGRNAVTGMARRE